MMSLDEVNAFLKIQVATQAAHQELKRKLFDCYNFDDSLKEALERVFESNNKIICINMDLTRKYRSLIQELNKNEN